MIVLGSRGSDLAMAQTRSVARLLRTAAGVETRIEVIETTGDRITDRPLAAIGVKGAFTVELEQALRSGAIDVATHSLKDLPVDDPGGLCLGAVPARADPADVIVGRREIWCGSETSTEPDSACALAAGTTVGTSSPRRRAALQIAAPDAAIVDIRGNVPTRVQRVREGSCDAVVLAAAGLDRLGLDLHGLERRPLPVQRCPPAPGQGALAIQCRRDDARTLALLRPLHDLDTARCVGAERELLRALGGGCSMPLGALVARDTGAGFRLRAALFGGPGPSAVRADREGAEPTALVQEVAAAWQALVGEPLAGLRVALPRPDGIAGSLGMALGVAGAAVEPLCWTRTQSVPVDAAEMGAVLDCAALAFSSTRAVRHFDTACRAIGRSLLEVPRLFAVGPATATALMDIGADPCTANGSGGAALADLLAGSLPSDAPVGYPCAVERHSAFETTSAARGLRVHALPVYRTTGVDSVPRPASEPHVLLLTAPSAVASWQARAASPDSYPVAAIGAATAAALRDAGVEPVAGAEHATLDDLVPMLREVRDARAT
ncbi:MAG: hydroxymethylbilane synthase [Planctomycetota bacterium]